MKIETVMNRGQKEDPQMQSAKSNTELYSPYAENLYTRADPYAMTKKQKPLSIFERSTPLT